MQYRKLTLLCQLAVFESLRLFSAKTHLPVLFVFGIASLEEINLGVALEGENVCCDSVEEPAVVAYYHCTACKTVQAVLQSADSVDIHIVGRLVEQEHIAFILESEGKVEPVPFTTGEHSAELFLVCTGEVEAADPAAGVDIPIAQAYPF